GSTVVIIPPHGDMKDYLDSLHMLGNYPIAALAPGHGELILDPRSEIRGVIAHRLQRQAKVIEVMERRRDGTLLTLTPMVDDDVDASRHPMARYSLWAPLLKLEREGRVVQRGDEWHWRG